VTCFSSTTSLSGSPNRDMNTFWSALQASKAALNIVMHHTSHVTRHTPHVTRHTYHVTFHWHLHW
jgi:hypothetical protein